jgi:hypothetical protein
MGATSAPFEAIPCFGSDGMPGLWKPAGTNRPNSIVFPPRTADGTQMGRPLPFD